MLKSISRLGKKYPPEPISVVVGFTQRYALFVHENMQAKHPVGQAKFLETPARELGSEIGRIVRTAVARGVSIGKALILGGLRLQREAQLLCPVDTSALKSSAFTVPEEDLEEKSQQAFEKSEAIRKIRPSRHEREARRRRRTGRK